MTRTVKAVLRAHGIEADVTSRTYSFEGFGYGQGCSTEVAAREKLPWHVIQALQKVEEEARACAGGPVFSPDQKDQSSFMISLAGPAYAFGGRVAAIKSDPYRVRHIWRVKALTTGRETTYTSTSGRPVNEEHVRSSPSVQRWAGGEELEVDELEFEARADEKGITE